MVCVCMFYYMKNFMLLSVFLERVVVWCECYNIDCLCCDFVKMFVDGVVEFGMVVMVGGYGDWLEENGDLLFFVE